jgi:hypothetical protein
MADNEIMPLANKVSRNTVAVIDALVGRGAFKGEELTTIGQLRDASLHLISLIEAAELEAEDEDEE